MPKMLAEFLVYMEAENVYHIHDIQESHLKAYLNYLYERPNYKWDGGLSKNYIRKQVQTIKKFSRYLTESGQESFVVKMRIKGKSSNVKGLLSRLEVQRLYDAAEDNVMGLRDRVILALYYGCGLRKNEGVNVNVSDVLMDKDMIYVRKGKGYKERYVPINSHTKTDLENYIHLARPYLTAERKDDALLLSVKGKRLSGYQAYKRLQFLRVAAMIDKHVGLHSLRHSIATHLLESGMELEHIQHFLGHSSLESTQIYTHLKHEQV